MNRSEKARQTMQFGIHIFFQMPSFAAFSTSLAVAFNYSLHAPGHRVTPQCSGTRQNENSVHNRLHGGDGR